MNTPPEVASAAEPEELFENDQIAHFKALRDHYEAQLLRTAFDNRQLVKANNRLQQKIEQLEKELSEKELTPAAEKGKVLTIDASKKKEA